MKNTLFLALTILFAVNAWQCVRTDTQPAQGEWVCSTQIPEDYKSLERDGRPPDPMQGVAAKTKLWANGSTVTVGFLAGGGSQIERDSVRRACALISAYANLNLSVTEATTPRPDIVVAFQNSGAWSYIGTDARYVQSGQTLNLAPWALQQRGTYVHELLHACGVLHELQHPDGPCLDTAVVLEYYRRTQGWSDQQIFWNVLTRHDRSSSIYTAFDPASVMSYGAPAAHTCNKVGLSRGTAMSAGDRALLQKIYPGRGGPIDPPTGITITAAQAQELRQGAANVQNTANAAKAAADAHRAKIQTYLGQ